MLDYRGGERVLLHNHNVQFQAQAQVQLQYEKSGRPACGLGFVDADCTMHDAQPITRDSLRSVRG